MNETMPPRHVLTTLLLLSPLALMPLLPAGAGGQAPTGAAKPGVELRAIAGSTLTIRGSTTIGANWHCTAADLEATATLDTPAGAGDLRGVRGVTVEVPVAALRCQSAPMERAMRAALKADRDPASTILGRFANPRAERIDGAESNGGADGAESAARLSGTLRVAGVQQDVSLRAEVAPQPGGTFLVRSTVPLTLRQFGITPPRVLFGAVRARDAITVEVKLLFRAATAIASRAPLAQ